MHPTATAPPPSPPWAETPTGQREKGRGWLLQHKLAKFLSERVAILHANEPFALRAALSEIALMAVESTITTADRSSWLSGVHPVAFRKACVTGSARSANGKGSVVEALAELVKGSTSEADTALALQALEAIALDDPTTDVDNDHALAICATSVVPSIIRLLSSPVDVIATRAAAATAALVENALASRMFLGAGAVTPLLTLARAGSDLARRHALAALRMLAIDRDVRLRVRARVGVRDRQILAIILDVCACRPPSPHSLVDGDRPAAQAGHCTSPCHKQLRSTPLRTGSRLARSKGWAGACRGALAP